MNMLIVGRVIAGSGGAGMYLGVYKTSKASWHNVNEQAGSQFNSIIYDSA